MRYKCPLPPETVAVDTCCYVYDTENERYYLQSRYYDPELSRFINADALVSTGQGSLGNNMFAYCGNNPISRADFAGHAFVQMAYGFSDHLSLLCPALGGGGGGCSYALAGFNSVKDEIKKFKDFVTNESEEFVLKSNGISFYKGAMVIRADIGQHGGGASYGIIILDDNYTYNEYGIKTLNHEYGHFRHMNQIGIKAYTATTAIPSLIGAALSDPEGTGIQQYIAKNYFSQPWERIAEQLGGLNRGYVPGSDFVGSVYWLYTSIIGALLN